MKGPQTRPLETWVYIGSLKPQFPQLKLRLNQPSKPFLLRVCSHESCPAHSQLKSTGEGVLVRNRNGERGTFH